MNVMLCATDGYLLLLFFLGLCAGSFLNVVIYRLPLILQREWQAQCAEFNVLPRAANDEAIQVFNLCFPRSHCPSCKQTIPFWRNIPLLSYVLQGGRCYVCAARIPWTYPFVEVLAACLVVMSVIQAGMTLTALLISLFSLALLALIFIDINTLLLPDAITLPLLWLGLLVSVFHPFVSPQSAILGAVIGYVSLWGVGKGFYYLTGREGMGQGDYKLAAAISAWLGWQLFPLFILFAALLALLIGGLALLVSKKHWRSALPFGPFLAMSAWPLFLWGKAIQHAWYGLIL